MRKNFCKENNLKQRNGLDYRLENGEYFHFLNLMKSYYDYTLYNQYGEEIDECQILEKDEESQSLMQIKKDFADFTGIDELNVIHKEIDYEDGNYFQ